MSNSLSAIIKEHKSGKSVGIYSVCSANQQVLEASMRQALQDDSPLLLEATCNQVNQFGGYTGMTPIQFVEWVVQIAQRIGFPFGRIILGGDHLGPSPWQDEPAETAMQNARCLIRAYVEAGFRKIHLDASMDCADDSSPVPEETVALRTADLCQVAEETFAAVGSGDAPLAYVIGTEVPVPGGAQERLEGLQATSARAARQTIEVTREAFARRDLLQTWEQVIAVVVQPGVEFDDSAAVDYVPQKAEELVSLIEGYSKLVFEAHSTDYQTTKALQELVRDHFAILKVGPALTFAFREAVFALNFMEEELLKGKPGVRLSRIRERLDQVMLENPVHWQRHYQGDKRELAYSRRYSFSDRCRYYWPDSRVNSALTLLFENLSGFELPLPLISQFLPGQYEKVRSGRISPHPTELVYDRIREVVRSYAKACGFCGEPD
jgi:D-tagatose-1,6-bisphosphate aldolase subunit GatZ/KbaZ